MLTKKPIALALSPSASRTLLPLGAMIFSGLSMAQTAPAAAKTESTLPTATATATKEAAQDGYRATSTRVGKTLQDPHDIPQAITSVTNQLMEEQQVGSLKEALRNVSGLTFNAAEGGRSGDNMMLRGFYTFGDIYLDGMRDTAQYNRETFNLEQIDVLRGSAAMLFGRGQAGGVINQVSKQPMRVDSNKVTASVGTDQYREVTGDFNKALGESSGIRLNVFNRDESSWRENPANGANPEIHRNGLAIAAATGIGERDEFQFNHVVTKTMDIPDFGVSFDNNTHRVNTNFPAEYFWGMGNNFDDSETAVTTGTHIHRFSPVSQLRTSVRAGKYDRVYWAKTPNATQAPSATGATGGNQNRYMEYQTTALQSDYNNKLELLGMKHELVTGIEYFHEENDRSGLQNLGTTSAPYYTPSVRANNSTTFHANSYAFYAQDSIEFVRDWTLTLGGRRDKMKALYSSATAPSLEYGENSYRGGLSWKPTEAQHYYVSYSDAFSPTADLYQLTVQAQPPERSNTVEVGGKWLFLGGDLSFTTALYSTTKEWERNTDLESTASILTKKRRTRGVDFEVTGSITPAWQIFSGLSLMDAEIQEVAENYAANGTVTKADPRLQGQTPRNTPDYTFNLWTTYRVAPHWKVGGGVEAKGKRYVYQPSTTNASSLFDANGNFNPNTAPAYQRWDLMVAYEQLSYAIRVNLRNVFDKVYYDALYDNGGFAVPGTRRAVIVTGEYKF